MEKCGKMGFGQESQSIIFYWRLFEMKKFGLAIMLLLFAGSVYAADYTVVSDDFEDGDYTGSPAWTVDGASWEVLQEGGGNDYLHQYIGSGDWGKIHTSYSTFDSGKFELTMKFYAETNATRTRNYFSVFVTEGVEEDGYYAYINQLVGTPYAAGVEIKRLDAGSGTALSSGNDYDAYGGWHDLKLTLDSGTLTLYLDDMVTPYLTATDSTYTAFDTISIVTRRDTLGWRFDDVNLVAQGITNLAPTVDAGLCQEITLPTNSVSLDGSVSDDGEPDPPGNVSVQWTVQSKPSGSTVNFTPSATQLDPTATFSTDGVYVLKLTGNDSLETSEDLMSVRVFPAGYNEASSTISDVSSSAAGQEAYNLVNGRGLGSNGAGSHTIGSSNTMWRNEGVLLFSQEYVVFRLDGIYDLEGLRLWNYNQETLSSYGVSVLDVYVSPDSNEANFTLINTFDPVAQAPEVGSYDFSEILDIDPLDANDVQYVRFEFFDNWGGLIRRIGLSEVRFIGDASNLRPVMDAGDDDYTWFDGGVATYQTAATVTDDGIPDPPATIYYQWSVTDAPAGATVTFDPVAGDVEDPLVTFSDPGHYELGLTVSDSVLTNFGRVEIDVYSDACAAAKGQAGFALLTGDIDADCKVNLSDFALMAANWLECNSEVCP